MSCDNNFHPCNHQIRFAVAGPDGQWTPVDFALAWRSSVPDLTYLSYGDWGGEAWGGLWVTYVDVFHGNMPDADQPEVLTTATVAFPLSAVQTAAGLAAVLAGEGPEPWVYRQTNSWELGNMLVDPDREMFADDEGIRHLMAVIDLDLETGPPDWENVLYVLESEDGFTFELSHEVDIGNPGTDPDFHPLGFDGPYPGVLPMDWAPGGDGAWATHAAGGGAFSRWEGDLFGFEPTGIRKDGITVVETSLDDGEAWTHGHAEPSDSAVPGQTDLVRTRWEGDAYGPVEILIDADDHDSTRWGLFSPTWLRMADDVEMVIFHTLLDPPPGWER